MRRLIILRVVVLLVACVPSAASFAQQTEVAFGGLKHDSSQQIEITSDSLSVDQGKATAEFKGTVLAGQGTLRINADQLLVEYKTDGKTTTGEIYRMSASGNVTLTNGAEAAEAEEAVYVVADGKIRMAGDVLLTQGLNAISGSVLNIDLNSGNAVFEGRVRTILQPQDNK